VLACALTLVQQEVAICPNSNEIQIYVREGNEFALEYTLAQHDSVVTGIDWAPNTDRIVSCSQDRNAYVWTFAQGEWKPALVILRINRAATSCKWSPLGES
jgi:actin related protein 2/3 complex subunit 1A/1B